MAAAPLLGADRPAGPLVETHIHLFARDRDRFPIHANAPYDPQPSPLEDYVKFVAEAGIDHTVIVHPEPYQDDHRYLEYCFANEPSPGFFKGTCLFDPIAPATRARMAELVAKHPGRIVALRIHQMLTPGEPPTTSGAITGRDMRSPAMRETWRHAQELGLAIQMHFLPYYASQIGELAGQFPDLPVILDHLGRAGQGTPEQFNDILALAKFPKVYIKYSGVGYSSNQPYPHADAAPVVRRAYDAFGPERMLWGGLGANAQAFEQATRLFDQMFAFASEADRARIRGGNAIRLFGR